MDGDMAKIDEAINLLHADMRTVIIAHYVWPGLVKTKADRLRVEKRVYYFTLEHAHKQLSQAMGGVYTTGYEPKLCTHLEQVCT